MPRTEDHCFCLAIVNSQQLHVFVMDSKVPPHSVNTSNKGSYLFPYFPGLGNLLAVNRQNIARGVQIMQLQVTQFPPDSLGVL
jgi:hypothetical protein